MKTAGKPTIDRLGRIAVPKAIREQAGIQPGIPISIRCRDGCVETEPALADLQIVPRGKIRVAKPKGNLPPLSGDIVMATQELLRGHRG